MSKSILSGNSVETLCLWEFFMKYVRSLFLLAMLTVSYVTFGMEFFPFSFQQPQHIMPATVHQALITRMQGMSARMTQNFLQRQALCIEEVRSVLAEIKNIGEGSIEWMDSELSIFVAILYSEKPLIMFRYLKKIGLKPTFIDKLIARHMLQHIALTRENKGIFDAIIELEKDPCLLTIM